MKSSEYFLQSVDNSILRKEGKMLISKIQKDLFPKACADKKRDNSLQLEGGRFSLNVRKKLYYEDGGKLDWVAQRSCWLVSGIWCIGRCPCLWQRGCEEMPLTAPTNPSHSVVLWYWVTRSQIGVKSLLATVKRSSMKGNLKCKICIPTYVYFSSMYQEYLYF